MNEKSDTMHTTPKIQKKGQGGMNVAIIITMVIVAGILVGVMMYQYNQASESEVTILDVEVEIKEVGSSIYIMDISSSTRKMNLFESPRMDSESKFPGVRVKVFDEQNLVSYDAFVEYKGSGTYDLVVGFRDTPEDGKVLSLTVWVYTGAQGTYPDDQEEAELVWGADRSIYVLEAKISINGTFSTGSDADITAVNVSRKVGAEVEANKGSKYPGIFVYVERSGELISYTACEGYTGGDDYMVSIGLSSQPHVGDELTIIVKIWQRDGHWLEGFYRAPMDTYSTTYTWR